MKENRDSSKRSYVQDLRDACFRYRADNRLSQEAMGKLLGVSRGAVGNFEKSRTFLGEAAIDKLMEITQDETLHAARVLRNTADLLLDSSVDPKRRMSLAFDNLASLYEFLRNSRMITE